jgi:hypothetical protein
MRSEKLVAQEDENLGTQKNGNIRCQKPQTSNG